MTIHADWLSLIEVSGAFLAEPVLDTAFPQGLEGFPTHKRQTFRQTYEEWREAQDNDDELKDQLHIEWINWVLRVGLEWDEDGSEEDLKSQSDLPESLSLSMPEHGLIIKPDYALFGDDKSKPFVIVQTYTADTDLNKVLGSDGWSTSPAERMSHLCKATGVRLGLITNGEQWMLVDAREGSITSYATWYARLWSQERSTLKSFYSLLNISAFFNGLGLDAKKLSELLDESLKHQDEVTETLGSQVQRAVEVLIQSLDRINKDKNGELLKGVEPSELYEAGLTYMMRLVFLLCAEERGLLLLGDETYESNYAVSTLRMKLREEAGQHGEEVLGFRNNAWSRLLAVFRAVYGGIEHEELRMPALGGSLFDPDRFPFLEGRPKGSNWRIDAAHPLPIDNRTVLLFLDAIQLYQGRTLSYRALDVEQIGYVYEGLLEKTVIRADDVTLELKATQKSKTPWLKLGELASAELDGDAKVLALLEERTGSSASRVKNDYNKALEPSQTAELLLACNNNTELRDQLIPYFHFLREDALGKPLIYAKNAFIVATGQDRRETGTHYTPKSLTEAVVKETLEPLVYEGPSAGIPREDWKLKTAEELLDLKVCDPAMGSGAFLVQVVRYLGERVCEAWEQAEADGRTVTIDGVVCERSTAEELLPPMTETEARNLIARRLVAERCIYGVDINPLAVELAKLSIWLVTLSKGRPFGFLDHNLRSGDSLLGVHRIEQLTELAMNPTGKGQQRIFGREIERAVDDAVELRKRIRSTPIRDIRDVISMTSLDEDARSKLELPNLVADAFISDVLVCGKQANEIASAVIAIGASTSKIIELDLHEKSRVFYETQRKLAVDRDGNASPRKPLHWCLEFPEVFSSEKNGFDAIAGNVPFLGAKKISGAMGKAYREYLSVNLSESENSQGDLAAYFLLRCYNLLSTSGFMGIITTNSIAEGDNRQMSLEPLLEDKGAVIYRAFSNETWPGKASVITSRLHIGKSEWNGEFYLNEKKVNQISAFLSARNDWTLMPLKENKGKTFTGTYILGDGFVLDHSEAASLIEKNRINAKVIQPYLNGKDLNEDPHQKPSRWVINFYDWPMHEALKYPEIFALTKHRVEPERLSKKDKNVQKYPFWLHWRPRSEAYHELGRGKLYIKHPKGWNDNELQFSKTLVICRHAKDVMFSFVENDSVFSDATIIFTYQSYSSFAILQSAIHNVFVWKFASKMGLLLRYTPSDVFLPFPMLTEQSTNLDRLGMAYHEARKNIMLTRNIGLTKLYNLVSDVDDSSDDIVQLRKIIKEVDNAVLLAYGWGDIDLNHGFFEIENLPDNDKTRFSIDEEARNEILDRLIELNKQRFSQEKIVNKKSKSPSKTATKTDKLEKTNKQFGFSFTLNEGELSREASDSKDPGNQWGSSTIDQILAWLDDKRDWFGKTAILAGCGASESEWESAIAELIKDGDVESREIDGIMRYKAVE